MSETKHTPGPWEAKDERANFPREPFWIGANHPEAGFVSHAVVRSGCDEADELGDMWANARLIAAAPEMLEALELIAHGFECGAIKSKLMLLNVDDEAENAMPATPAAIVRAAIARATGA